MSYRGHIYSKTLSKVSANKNIMSELQNNLWFILFFFFAIRELNWTVNIFPANAKFSKCFNASATWRSRRPKCIPRELLEIGWKSRGKPGNCAECSNCEHIESLLRREKIQLVSAIVVLIETTSCAGKIKGCTVLFFCWKFCVLTQFLVS